jgi:hypothetical protein
LFSAVISSGVAAIIPIPLSFLGLARAVFRLVSDPVQKRLQPITHSMMTMGRIIMRKTRFRIGLFILLVIVSEGEGLCGMAKAFMKREYVLSVQAGVACEDVVVWCSLMSPAVAKARVRAVRLRVTGVSVIPHGV